MIDPQTLLLGTTAASLVASFFTKSVEEIGKKTAGLAWDKASEVVELLKRELSNEHEKSLAVLRETPQNEQARTQLASGIAETAAHDPQFAKKLSEALADAAKSGVDATFSTNIAGNVEKVTNIGVVHGNVTI